MTRSKQLSLVIATAVATMSTSALAQQSSSPVILQWFESSWRNIERRTPDLFNAGYGALWTPPPGRAIYLPEGGGIGYDPYDRFDLGKPRDATLYGTEASYVGAVRATQKFGGSVYVDYVHHHLGSLDMNLNGQTYRQGIINQGYAFPQFGGQVPYLQDRSDYPGFEVSDPNNPIPAVVGGNPTAARDTYAELYGSNSGLVPFGDVYEYWFRLRGATEGGNLITIDLASQNAQNRQFVRNPVPGNAQNIRQSGAAWNIPTTTITPSGLVGSSTLTRQANTPDANNARFYPDQNGTPRTVIDGGTSYTVYDFNLATPLAGDPVAENPLGYMMRYAQWMTQVVGVDGLRVDAARHVPLGVFNSAYNPNSINVPNMIDRAVAGASSRNYLDGSKRGVFQFQEIFNYDPDALKSFVRKSQNAGDTVNPNRDVLDFSMWRAMAQYMGGNGTTNDWFQIRSASMNAAYRNSLDPNIANDGTTGIGFVYNHDEGISPPGTGGTIVLDNVAHAWILMRPGNAYVYYRSNEFNRTGNTQFFLKNGRGDALGGQFGSILTTLVDVRNSYGRGDFKERWIDNAFNPSAKSAVYVFEREGSAIVGLNVGYNAGSTTRTVSTNLPNGTILEEVTGNWQDPSGGVRRFTQVAGGSVAIDIPWNNAGNGNKGYAVYGLPTPRGTLALASNDPTKPNTLIASDVATPATNGTARISAIDVIRADSFTLSFNTAAVAIDHDNNPGTAALRDFNADGITARFKIDEGHDGNGNGVADFPSSSSANVTRYGFENFLTLNTPGFGSPTGNGAYAQSISATNLSEGYHYLTVRAWRRQGTNESEVFKDYRKAIYVDRFDPESGLDSVAQFPHQNSSTVRDIRIKSLDATADSVHVFFDLPASLSDAQILGLVNPATNKADQIDRDLFGRQQTNVGSGLHTVISVTYEPTGRYKVHRFVGVPIQTTRGLGMGDVNYDGGYSSQDVNTFETALYSNVTTTTASQFVASGDLNGNGVIDTNDLFLLPGRYASVLANNAFGEAKAAITRRGDVNQSGTTNAADIDFLFTKLNQSNWYADLNADGVVTMSDADRLVIQVFNTQYGDTNLDGRVDRLDLDALAASFGQQGSTLSWTQGELNGDDIVDLQDFFALGANWGFGVAGGLAPELVSVGGLTLLIPEPATFACLSLASVLVLNRRTKR
jgi:alpha-amylase